MTTLFASDIHLSAIRPQRVEAFRAFLLGPCLGTEAVYLLGDIFDVWLGDDDHREPHPEALKALKQLTSSGVPVYFMTGNHDLLVGEEFIQASGCQAIKEPFTIEVHGQPVVLMHGDALCTRDLEYQAWRRAFSDPRNQQGFLALSFEDRLAQAAKLQLESSTQTALKTEDIMDVTPEAALEVLVEAQATHMIHGHTHRPAVHSLQVNGCDGARIVLGDWYDEETILAWDEKGYRLCSVSELEL